MSVLDLQTAPSALSPIAKDVMRLLGGSPALAAGGVHDYVPQDPTYPFVLFEIDETPMDAYGRAATVIAGDILLHVFSLGRGMAEARRIMVDAIGRLRESGYYLHDQTTPFANELVRGVEVRELVGRFRVFAGASQ